jgi:PAS domain S-box-containing protein
MDVPGEAAPSGVGSRKNERGAADGPGGSTADPVIVAEGHAPADAGRSLPPEALSAMPDGVIVMGADGVIRTCNEAAAAMIGLPRERMIGRDARLPFPVHPVREDGTPLPRGETPGWVALRTGRSQRGVVIGLRDGAGRTTWVSAGAEPLFRPGEAVPEAVVLSFSDITARRAAEARVRESEARFRAVVDGLSEGLIMVGPDRVVTLTNPAGERMLGLRVGDIACGPGGRLTDLLTLEDGSPLPPEMCPLSATLADGRPRSAERVGLRRPHGGAAWLSVRTFAVSPEGGGPSGAAATFTDVTERHEAERGLREYRDRFRRLMESDIVGIYVTTPAGPIREANEGFLRMIGRSREELSGGRLSWRDVTAPEGLADCEGLVAALQRSESIPPHEKEYLRPDGTRVPVLQAVVRLRPGGDEALVLAVDLRERRRTEAERARLEEDLRQAAKMEAIGRLAGGVAHDFNNILAGIVGFAETGRAGPGVPAAAADAFAEILKAADRAAALTRQLLAFSRKSSAAPRVLDLNALVSDMAALLRRLIGRDIDMVVVPSERPALVRADRGRIEQVLLNLAVNARDAMPSGGRLTVMLAHVELDDPALRRPDAAGGPHVMLSVSDTGVGMDEATRARLFEPFFSTKERGRGTGLGLATVYGAVRDCNGHIRVDSRPGAGSVFRVYLPAAGGPAEDSRGRMRAAAAEPPGGGETILVADDEDTPSDAS